MRLEAAQPPARLRIRWGSSAVWGSPRRPAGAPSLLALTLQDPEEQAAEPQLKGTPAYADDNFM
jgi:hypothetical protein